MIDATGNPQTVLLLGGTSEIGLAIVKEYLAKQPLRVVLGIQPGDDLAEATVADLTAAGATHVTSLEFGGRMYTAKDSRTTAETFHAMYPGIDGWIATRRRIDPHGVFASDLARRLELL